MKGSNNQLISMGSMLGIAIVGALVVKGTAFNFRPPPGEESGATVKSENRRVVDSRLWEDPFEALKPFQGDLEFGSALSVQLAYLRNCVANYGNIDFYSVQDKKDIEKIPFGIWFSKEKGPLDYELRLAKLNELFGGPISSPAKRVLALTLYNAILPNQKGYLDIGNILEKASTYNAPDIVPEDLYAKFPDLFPLDKREIKLTPAVKKELSSLIAIHGGAKAIWESASKEENKNGGQFENLFRSLKRLSQNRTGETNISEITKEIQDLLKEQEGNRPLLPLFVMMPGGRGVEAKESRRRIRRAILTGMMDHDYFPESSGSLSIFRIVLNQAKSKIFLTESFKNEGDRIDVVYIDENQLMEFGATKNGCGAYLDSLRAAVLKTPGAPLIFLGPCSSDAAKMVGGCLNAYFLTASATAIGEQNNIFQFIPSDEKYSQALAEELAQRGLETKDMVLLICEGDSVFGQKFPLTFSKSQEQFRIGVVRYLRGTDGGLAKITGNSGKSSEDATTTIWPPQGNHQFDGLQRIAIQLAKRNGFKWLNKTVVAPLPGFEPKLKSDQNPDRSSIKTDEKTPNPDRDLSKIKAVGVIGYDVYDKLVIIQMFRPLFPQAVFFTTDLDAEFLRKEITGVSQGLIVAGSSSLSPSRNGGDSFRDSFQSGLYNALDKVVLDKLLKDTEGSVIEGKLKGTPATNAALYEVGDGSFIRLDTLVKDEQPKLFLRKVFLSTGVFLILATWSFFLRSRAISFSILAAYIAAILGLAYFGKEPGGLLSLPPSIWLSEEVRLIGVVASVLWFWIIIRSIPFGFKKFPETWGERWKEVNETRENIMAGKIDSIYMLWLCAVPAAWLVAVMWAVVVGSGFFEVPVPPTRGHYAFYADALVLASIIGSFCFLFCVAGAGILGDLRRLMVELGDFDAERAKGVEDLTRWMRTIQNRSEPFSGLIFPPFLLLCFSLLSRQIFFDSWGNSAGLMIAFGILALLLLLLSMMHSYVAGKLKAKFASLRFDPDCLKDDREFISNALTGLDRGPFAGWLASPAIIALFLPILGNWANSGSIVQLLNSFY